MKLRNPLYWLYGAMILGGSTYLESSGVTFASIKEQRVAPRSVRDNPGSYRPSYAIWPRYTGGK
jgi:hypothetical protein